VEEVVEDGVPKLKKGFLRTAQASAKGPEPEPEL
jgi:hypothetical protein